MQSTDPDIDPVARQYIPSLEELALSPQERLDPIGDHEHSPVKGIVHRYPDHLLKITPVCPVYCRYCFRKDMVGPQGEALGKADRAVALDYIANMPEIWEVILTGGDPLMLSAGQLRDTLAALAAMEHVKVVRFHTRTPIAAPNLVSADHLAVFAGFEKALYMALHINHAQELTPQVRDRIKALDKEAGIVMLSQSVLLRGVNDDVEALAALFGSLCFEG